MLPAGLSAELWRGRWPEPAVFGLIQRLGRVADDEMYRTFNLGVGMMAVVTADAAERAMAQTGALDIGRVVAGDRVTVVAAGGEAR